MPHASPQTRPNAFFDSCLGAAPVFAVANSFVRASVLAVGMLFLGVLVALASLAGRRIFGEGRGKAFLFSAAVFGVTLYTILARIVLPADFNFMGPYLALLAFNGMTILLADRCDRDSAPFGDSARDALSWAMAVVVFGFLREFLGTGGVVLYGSDADAFGFSVPGISGAALRFFLHPGGGLLLFGLLAGMLDFTRRIKRRRSA